MYHSVEMNVLVVICITFSHNFLTTGTPLAPIDSTTTDPTTDIVEDISETTTTTTAPIAITTTTSNSPVVSSEVSARSVEKMKVQDKRLYSSTSPHEETVTNEVSEKRFEDLEFLCHHYYKDELVVSAHVSEAGCQLECVFLTSSGLHGDGFFDKTVRKHHNINEGQGCDPENSAFKCINGTCIEPPETGKAVISIVNGTFAGPADEAGEVDPYVKLYLDQKYLMKTRTIEGSNNPTFNQAFVTPFITSDTQIGFLVFNRDDSEEKLLLTVHTTVDFILAMNLNGTTTCQPQGSPRGRLCFSIKWFREVG